MSRNVGLHLAITALVLLAFNGLIVQKELVLRRGTSVLLALAPVDPRSLMQGDYMRLRYKIAEEAPRLSDQEPSAGRVVLRRDEKRVGAFVRIDHGEALNAGEFFVRYRRSVGGEVRLGAESFFFQEGDADRLARAKYGELKVAPSGESVLVGLCDDQLQRLGVTPAAAQDAPR